MAAVKTMRKTAARSLLAILVLASAASGVSFMQASAAVANCHGSGWTCVWANANYGSPSGSGGAGNFSNSTWFWGAYGSSGACIPGQTAAPDNQGGWNDCASSAKNEESSGMGLYINWYCGGAEWTLGGGSSVANFHNIVVNGVNFNDAISSDHYPGRGSC